MKNIGSKVEVKNKLAVQMVLWFAVISLLPLGVATYFNYRSAAKELHVLVSDNLQAISQRQSKEMKAYLGNQERFVSVLSMTSDVVEAFEQLGKGNEIQKRDYQALLRGLVEQFGFGQMYLIGTDGQVLLSTVDPKEALGSVYDIEDEDELGVIFDKTIETDTPQISRLTVDSVTKRLGFYLSAPVQGEQGLLGGIVLEVDADKVYDITQNYMGLGTTGETLIGVKSKTGDTIVVNPTRHDKDAIAYRNLTQQGLVDNALENALSGQSGSGLVSDYRGEEVIAAWEYLPKMGWGLVVKEDRAETHVPILELRRFSLFVGICTLIIVLAVAVVVAGSISQPIVGLTQVAQKIAKGDLTPRVDEGPANEIGTLSQAIDLMAKNLKSLVNQVKGSGSQVAATVQEVSKTVEEQLTTAQSTGAASIDITGSAKKISETANGLKNTMKEVNEVAQETALLAESGIDGLHTMEESMEGLSSANTGVSKELALIYEKAHAIGGIITTMTKVADQTNLLSLNAAIEARKAGEYGKGFKVVAREISRLADQVAQSTLEIEKMIKEMSGAVNNGVESMGHLSKKVKHGVREITTISNHLATVIQRVQGLPPRFEMVLEGMESQAQDAEMIKESIAHLSSQAHITIDSLSRTNDQLERLEGTAAALHTEISSFET